MFNNNFQNNNNNNDLKKPIELDKSNLFKYVGSKTVQDSFNDIIKDFVKTDSIKVVEAVASSNANVTATESVARTTNAIVPPLQDINTTDLSSKSSDEILQYMDLLINEFKKNSDTLQDEGKNSNFEDNIKKLRNILNPSDEKIDLRFTDVQLPKEFVDEPQSDDDWIKNLPADTPDHVKQRALQLHQESLTMKKKENDQLKRGIREAQAQLQEKLSKILPYYIKAEKEKSGKSFTSQDAEALAKVFAMTPLMGDEMKNGIQNFIEAQASYVSSSKENGKIAADTLEKMYKSINDFKLKNDTLISKMDNIKRSYEELREENEKLKSKLPFGNESDRFKKIDVAASSSSSLSNSYDNDYNKRQRTSYNSHSNAVFQNDLVRNSTSSYANVPDVLNMTREGKIAYAASKMANGNGIEPAYHAYVAQLFDVGSRKAKGVISSASLPIQDDPFLSSLWMRAQASKSNN